MSTPCNVGQRHRPRLRDVMASLGQAGCLESAVIGRSATAPGPAIEIFIHLVDLSLAPPHQIAPQTAETRGWLPFR